MSVFPRGSVPEQHASINHLQTPYGWCFINDFTLWEPTLFFFTTGHGLNTFFDGFSRSKHWGAPLRLVWTWTVSRRRLWRSTGPKKKKPQTNQSVFYSTQVMWQSSLRPDNPRYPPPRHLVLSFSIIYPQADLFALLPLLPQWVWICGFDPSSCWIGFVSWSDFWALTFLCRRNIFI